MLPTLRQATVVGAAVAAGVVVGAAVAAVAAGVVTGSALEEGADGSVVVVEPSPATVVVLSADVVEPSEEELEVASLLQAESPRRQTIASDDRCFIAS